MKVTVKEECGNAPRKTVLRDFNVALASANVDDVLKWVSDDITWKLVGNQVVEGKPAFEKALGGSNMKVAELVIENIITHGKTAAVDGELELENGFRLSFCDIYRFTSAGRQAKINQITAYVVSSPG
ncbi:MAG: nuclear transport factor 2 family protein [Solirubrobacterales bacterium]